MAGANPAHFDITIEPDKIEVDFYQILETVRPLWTKSDYVFERSEISVSRGLLNTMVKCYSKTNDSDAIMIRIHNVNVNKWLDRNTEVKCLKVLAPLDCAPAIIATFTNGFCYQFFHGTVLSHSALGEDPIWRLTASDLAKFHSTEINGDFKENSVSHMKDMMDKMWAMFPEELKDPVKNEIFKRDFPPKEELEKEILWLRQICEDTMSPLVLCHNDTRAENIIWNEEEQRIHFVDFEAMSYNYQAAEISSHFQRYCGIEPIDFALMPTEEFQMKWLRYYLEKYYEFTGKNPSDVTEKDVRRLFVQVKKRHLLFLLMTLVFGPAFDEMNIIPEGHIDMFAFAVKSHKEYLKQKDVILAMKMPE